MYNVNMNRKYLKRKDVNLVPLRVMNRKYLKRKDVNLVLCES